MSQLRRNLAGQFLRRHGVPYRALACSMGHAHRGSRWHRAAAASAGGPLEAAAAACRASRGSRGRDWRAEAGGIMFGSRRRPHHGQGTVSSRFAAESSRSSTRRRTRATFSIWRATATNAPTTASKTSLRPAPGSHTPLSASSRAARSHGRPPRLTHNARSSSSRRSRSRRACSS